MPQINQHYLKLQASYLFPEIGRRVDAYCAAHPGANVIRMGIGDVTEPLPPAVIEAMQVAVDEMGRHETFRGYGPYYGYDFLRQAIADSYAARGVTLAADEIFVSDGSKCDSANLLDIFGAENTVAVLDPVYPVYVDTNVMAGRTEAAGEDGYFPGLLYVPLLEENQFVPRIPDRAVDLIYLCFPNNPTGTVISHEVLKEWVKYARECGAIIFYDAAYEAYIRDPQIPRSIYEIEGAREVAIELRSFSKDAGFTGTRCAFIVLPRQLKAMWPDGQQRSLQALWQRRQSTKSNGVSYIVQRAAEAALTPAGQAQIQMLIEFYMKNAELLRQGLEQAGYTVYGGVHAPYVWMKTPEGQGSWEFFDWLLENSQIVGTPGSGFGPAGEGFFRLSAFNSRENIERATDRLARLPV